jgi:D-sedoheptulose 7-phosphate isomerase
MDIDRLYDREFDAHGAVWAATRHAIRQPFARLVEACLARLKAGGKIAFFGNGGSAADAQHLAAECVVRYRRDRAPIPALALTTDTSVLTAVGNDFGFERVFARQIEAVCRPTDVCIALSTSGNSENVIQGLAAAKRLGCLAAGFGGGDGGRMAESADALILVPSADTPRIQEMHALIGHMLCAALERDLSLP